MADILDNLLCSYKIPLMLQLVAIYESQVIPKDIKTNYFAPTKNTYSI